MQIGLEKIDPDAIRIVQRLRRFDHQAYLVGGCVRDVLLGGKPKDFDVATSATPNEIRRLFRNCRIIGRRFRLAHIFFGSKVIETSTFRANPRENGDDEAEAKAEAPAGGEDAAKAVEAGERGPRGSEGGDLYIRRDNVFGTAEEDARRRDFTINGLFLDVESGEIIDHVNGLPDIEARLVRTIGDPDIRFREDPVRILRAVKFAARCKLDIEPETYRRMIEHAGEVAKCAQARVSEEFFRLLRAGAAHRSMEILRETKLLEVLAPALSTWLSLPDAGDEALANQHARFWQYLAALDRQTARRETQPSNGLVLATLFVSALRDDIGPDVRDVRDLAAKLAEIAQPIIDQIRASRRDSDQARQILLSVRHVLPSQQPNRRRWRFGNRELLEDTLRLAELMLEAEGGEEGLAKATAMIAELAPAPTPMPAPPPADLAGIGSDRPRAPVAVAPSGRALPPIPELPEWVATNVRPSFLGNGPFGARWGAALD